jgi:hypothetical protein
MANSTMRELQFEREKSTNASSNVLYQAKYLPELLQRLEKDPQSVLDDCEQFRQACTYCVLFLCRFTNEMTNTHLLQWSIRLPLLHT